MCVNLYIILSHTEDRLPWRKENLQKIKETLCLGRAIKFKNLKNEFYDLYLRKLKKSLV